MYQPHTILWVQETYVALCGYEDEDTYTLRSVGGPGWRSSMAESLH